MYLIYLGLYNKKTPKIGEKVAVKSPSKNKFTRAIISKKVNDTTYSVYYVDYGDKENVKAINIFLLPYRFRYVCFFFMFIIFHLVKYNANYYAAFEI